MSGNRYFVGIGVGDYDDPSLNLEHAVSDVERVSHWFIEDSGVRHTHELGELGASPTWTSIVESLREFLLARDEDDVVVIWFACHGEQQGSRVYLFGRDTPREVVAGKAVDADVVGQILGQSQPHNVLLVIDACVSGRLGTVIQRAAEDMADEMNTRRPHKHYAQAVIASAYARDPAHDGRFADAFLEVVSQERWTGATSEWISIDQLIGGLNQVLRELELAQVADRRVWGPGAAELIPNPNFARRRLVGLGHEAEFAAHFDPASRGLLPGEEGSFFTGRENELIALAAWLSANDRSRQQSMKVITGSPGSGKSALLARLVVLADAERRPNAADLSGLPELSLPPQGSIDGVIWCHNKSARQIVEELATALGGTANDVDGLLEIAANGSFTIAVDSLDEAVGDDAAILARDVLRPLADNGHVRFLVATRRRAVHARDAATSLLDLLGSSPKDAMDLDASPDRLGDIRKYVGRRLEAAGVDPAVAVTLSQQIADAAGPSFLVAALATRSAEIQREDEEYLLPSSVGEALAAYVDRMPNPTRARDLLRPLAWARGSGLPWGTLWPFLAGRLADAPGPSEPQPTYDDADVVELLDHGGDLIVESTTQGNPVYRLFHEALAEHLRSERDEIKAHSTIASAMLDDARGRPWPSVDRYSVQNLPAFLRVSGRFDELLDVLLDPSWERAMRETAKDPLAAADDVDKTIALLLQSDPEDLRVVPLCHVHSQNMSSAPPLVVDVLARSGQSARASVLANNLTAANDRLLAYQLLAEVYADQGNFSAARSCAHQVELAVAAMPPTHRPMAWFRVARSCRAARVPGQAERAAAAALEAALTLEGDGWDVHNGLFWAGCAARLVDDQATLARIRGQLDADAASGSALFRNQTLQAAAVAGHRSFLRDRLDEWREGRPHYGPIRDGNLALALADAGMTAELERVIREAEASPRREENDAAKRWAWALAMSGRLEQAEDAAGTIPDAIERTKAIARVTEVALSRGDANSLDRLARLATLNRKGLSDRAQARIARILWQADKAEEAIELAEEVIASTHEPHVLRDPRDEEGRPALGLGHTPGPNAARQPKFPRVKTGRRELVTSSVPVEDARRSREVAELAESGDLNAAEDLVREITVPLYRARGFAAIASHSAGPGQLQAWLRAMESARPAGRGVVLELEQLGFGLLEGQGRLYDLATLRSKLAELDTRWELERFAEQYATLRSTLASGDERTRRMTTLLVVPRVSAATGLWRKEDLVSTWASGDIGRRLFVIGLMQGDPALAVPDILVQGIRDSRSAFEQYHALQAALACEFSGDDASAVRRAVHAEVTGIRRPDGSEATIGPQSNRIGLARRLLDQLAP